MHLHTDVSLASSADSPKPSRDQRERNVLAGSSSRSRRVTRLLLLLFPALLSSGTASPSGPAAPPARFAVLSDDPGPWPQILSSVGFHPQPRASNKARAKPISTISALDSGMHLRTSVVFAPSADSPKPSRDQRERNVLAGSSSRSRRVTRLLLLLFPALLSSGTASPSGPAAPPAGFAVLADDPGPWPQILSSVGFHPQPAGAADIVVLRPGSPAASELAARVEQGARKANFYDLRPGFWYASTH